MRLALGPFAVLVGTLCVCVSCHHAAASQSPLGASAVPPGGPVCSRTVVTDVAPAVLFHEATKALATLKLSPTVADSVSTRVILDGASAPRARGTAAQQQVHLTFSWQVLPADTGTATHVIYLAPGVSTWPAAMSEEHLRALALQADALASRFMRELPSAPKVFDPVCNSR